MSPFDDVDAIVGDDVVGAAAVGTGNVNLVVFRVERRVFIGVVVVDVERAQIVELAFPQHAAGVDVAGTQAVHPLDEQSSADDLLRRTVAVSRQHVHVAAAAEPQHAQRQLDAADRST